MVRRVSWFLLATWCGLTGCTDDGDHGTTLDPGARLYRANCVPCHQDDARGIPGVYPSLVGSPVLLGDPTALALWVVKGQRPATMPTGRYPTRMLQFGWMKAADAAALFTYLRSHFGNSAPAVDAAVLAPAFGDAGH